jgi:hypothetical protein
MGDGHAHLMLEHDETVAPFSQPGGSCSRRRRQVTPVVMLRSAVSWLQITVTRPKPWAVVWTRPSQSPYGGPPEPREQPARQVPDELDGIAELGDDMCSGEGRLDGVRVRVHGDVVLQRLERVLELHRVAEDDETESLPSSDSDLALERQPVQLDLAPTPALDGESADARRDGRGALHAGERAPAPDDLAEDVAREPLAAR